MLGTKTVAVIGGGSVGISYIYQLIEEAILEEDPRYLEILLFEPKLIVGPGYAYQQDLECNLLNTRADAMSAVARDKQHFLKWLADNADKHSMDYPDTQIEATEFLPRSLFGKYLSNHFEEACILAKNNGIIVRHIVDDAIDIIPMMDGMVCIDTKCSGAHTAHHAILCIGNLESTNFPHLSKTARFFNSPYPTQTLAQRIPKTASVCVLGTGLSAIDTVLSLVEGGYCGKIVLASRNGRLPSVRGIHNMPRSLNHLTRERIDGLASEGDGTLGLDQVFSVLQKEIEQATGQSCNLGGIMNLGAGIFDYLSTEILLSEQNERLWQSVIYSTNSVIDYVWHHLTLADKRRFHKTFASVWSSYRVSFPVKNAKKMRELLRTDRVIVLGGMKSVELNQITGMFETRIHDIKTGFRSIIESDHVINATGYSTDVSKTEVPLVKNLMKRGLAVANEFGGFDLDFETGELVPAQGKQISNISVLGSLAVGTYFWTNAMDVNARLAKGQVRDVLRKISFQKINCKQLTPDQQLLPYQDAIPKIDIEFYVGNLMSPLAHTQMSS